MARTVCEQSGAVLQEDVAPHGGVGAGHSGEVLEAGAGAVQGPLAAHLEVAGVVHEHVRQNVRQMADHSHDAVVGHGVDVRGLGAQLQDELLEHLIELREGRAGRAEEVGGALEQVGSGVADAALRGTAYRMAADEHRACQRREVAHDGRLGAAHVGDQARRGLRRRALLHQRRDAPHRGRDDHQVRIGRGLSRRRGLLGYHALGESRLERFGIGVVADHLVHLGPLPGRKRQAAAHHAHAHYGQPVDAAMRTGFGHQAHPICLPVQATISRMRAATFSNWSGLSD